MYNMHLLVWEAPSRLVLTRSENNSAPRDMVAQAQDTEEKGEGRSGTRNMLVARRPFFTVEVNIRAMTGSLCSGDEETLCSCEVFVLVHMKHLDLVLVARGFVRWKDDPDFVVFPARRGGDNYSDGGCDDTSCLLPANMFGKRSVEGCSYLSQLEVKQEDTTHLRPQIDGCTRPETEEASV